MNYDNMTSFKIVRSIGVAATQQRMPTRYWFWQRPWRENFDLLCASLQCCGADEDVTFVSQQINISTECDVEDLAVEIKNANDLLEMYRTRLLGGRTIESSLEDVRVCSRETHHMHSEDRNVGIMMRSVPLVRPAILDTHDEHMQLVEQVATAIIDGGAEAQTYYRVYMEQWFTREYGIDYEQVGLINDEYRRQYNATVVQVQHPDGTIMLSRRPHRVPTQMLCQVSSEIPVPQWTQADHDALVELSARLRAPRVVIPSLVAAIALDARARWGILEDTSANRLMVGHHMRKQLRNGSLRVSAVDMNVAPALNAFFTPMAIDVVAKGQALNWRREERWRQYDQAGLSWWQRRFLKKRDRSATQVV